ncbi:MAG: patatin family protein [Brooklawnia sp.]|uniref:patatin-like phospholipase family protein n=1 Tax=Brooklawnia sp. TaxID=2699740 RepID=UPI003C71ADC0
MTPKAPTRRLTSNIHHTALIFEGGGMRVSYTAAVVVALLEAGLHFDWVAGISAGSSNTANYLSRDRARARRSFVEFAADPQFGDLRTLIRGKGLFNSEYIYRVSGQPGQALPYDFDTFQANPARMRLGVFEADTGRAFYWTRDDVKTRDDLMARVQSSSTLPFFMPPVHIGDHVYADGALGPSGGIALDAARADGFTRFLAVLTRPRDYVKAPVRISRPMRQYFRKYPAILDALQQRATNYNRSREELLELERSGDAMIFFPEGFTVSQGERNTARLARSFADGAAQAARQLPAWREWLGV